MSLLSMIRGIIYLFIYLLTLSYPVCKKKKERQGEEIKHI